MLRYKLEKSYDDSRGNHMVVSRYLAVLKTQSAMDGGLRLKDEHRSLYKTCCWYWLRTLPESANTTFVTLVIALQQRFTAATLLELMGTASSGQHGLCNSRIMGGRRLNS